MTIDVLLDGQSQTQIISGILTELTNRDILLWNRVDTNCYSGKIGDTEFSLCKWPEGLEVNFNNLCFRGYGYNFIKLRDAVYRQQERTERCDKSETREFLIFTKTGEAPKEFLIHFDKCVFCQNIAAELAKEQSKEFKLALLKLISRFGSQ